MKPVFIAAARRTPIGRFGGSFKDLTAADLGVVAVRAVLEQTKIDPARVAETIFGNGRQAGGGPNVARQISIRAGIPQEVPAWTVNQACGSGLKAVIEGARLIGLGEAEAVVAGGTESMSRLPFMLDGVRFGTKLGHIEATDGMYRDGFVCPMARMLMGETAEILAAERKISREEQDAFALGSQAKAGAAIAAGHFASEIAPVTLGGKDAKVLSTDEHARPDTTAASLAKLPPVFSKTGTISAGNSSGITDGAAATLLVSEAMLEELGLEPLARIEAHTVAGVDPKYMGIGPVPAVRKLFEKTGLGMGDFDLYELNEAFAAQVIACDRDLHFDAARLNVNGGSIALGHPIGATGTRILTTLLHEMKRRNVKRGLATLCISGGMGLALSVVR